MNRLQPIDPANAPAAAAELLGAVKKKMGVTPNMTRAMANSPAVLKAYLDFSGALAGASLSPKLRERIALTVGEINACGYCLSAHTLIGGKLGLGEDEIRAARVGEASEPKDAAILRLAKEIVLRRGELRDADLRAARDAGVTDGEIAETVAFVALNLFTNYFNHVADPQIDFPVVEPGISKAEGEACSTGACSA